MFGLGMQELIVILVIALLLFGAEKKRFQEPKGGQVGWKFFCNMSPEKFLEHFF